MIPHARALAVLGEDADTQDLQNLIEGATATLGRHVLYYLGPPLERVELLDGYGWNGHWYGGVQTLDLEEIPTPDTDLTVETRDDMFSAWEDLDALDDDDTPNYVLDGRQLVHRSTWPAGRKTVRVTYVAGYDTGEGPQHFQELVLRMVVEGWNASLAAVTAAGGLKSEEIGDYKYTNFTAAELSAATASLGTTWEDVAKQWRRRLI